ncbi:MAG: cytochrome c oxidase subunit II [Nitrospinota bacterium]
MHSNRLLNALGIVALFATPAFAYSGGDGGGIIDPKYAWDDLWNHLLIDILVIGAIFSIAAIYLLFRFKATSPDQVGSGRKLSTAEMWGWALIPAFIFLADDLYLAAKGWTVWNIYRSVPENAMEVKVTGMQWSWDFEYENGVTSEVLKVPVGRPVVLRMSSDDVVHSFGLAHYRVKEDMLPGRVTYLWFYPDKPLKTVVTCTEYCGTAHAEMFTDVIAMPESEFNAWLDSEVKSADARQPVAEIKG